MIKRKKAIKKEKCRVCNAFSIVLSYTKEFMCPKCGTINCIKSH